jgi:hypothetical protein
MRVSSTLVQRLGNRDQLPDLCLVTFNGDSPYTPRHRPKAPPPFLILVFVPQVINGIGDFLPLVVLE